MRLNLTKSAPREVVDIHIRLPKPSRAELHFHLEASDGLGYLAQGESAELGIVHTPPDFVDEMLAWLEALAERLQIEILDVKSP